MEHLMEVELYMNTALCQSPTSIGKTAKAIQYIKHFSILKRFTSGRQEDGVHHMTAVLTNCSLPETDQWKHRSKKGTEEYSMNTYVLSSRKDSKYKSIAGLSYSMLSAKNASSLPDILVMCTHAKRIDDLIELITNLKTGNWDFKRIGIKRITLTIMFDEADANIELIKEFLQYLA